jgi:hypothetical protein
MHFNLYLAIIDKGQDKTGKALLILFINVQRDSQTLKGHAGPNLYNFSTFELH